MLEPSPNPYNYRLKMIYFERDRIVELLAIDMPRKLI
nr:MAG TPA: hypothetical protein [Caudoviricetes sp.]